MKIYHWSNAQTSTTTSTVPVQIPTIQKTDTDAKSMFTSNINDRHNSIVMALTNLAMSPGVDVDDTDTKKMVKLILQKEVANKIVEDNYWDRDDQVD